VYKIYRAIETKGENQRKENRKYIGGGGKVIQRKALLKAIRVGLSWTSRERMFKQMTNNCKALR
jgi:hypothetical protein